jgi:hypothetical protein
MSALQVSVTFRPIPETDKAKPLQNRLCSLMMSSPPPPDRFIWWLPLAAVLSAVGVLVSLMVNGANDSVLFIVLIAPIVCFIGLLWLLVAAIWKRPRSGRIDSPVWRACLAVGTGSPASWRRHKSRSPQRTAPLYQWQPLLRLTLRTPGRPSKRKVLTPPMPRPARSRRTLRANAVTHSGAIKSRFLPCSGYARRSLCPIKRRKGRWKTSLMNKLGRFWLSVTSFPNS